MTGNDRRYCPQCTRLVHEDRASCPFDGAHLWLDSDLPNLTHPEDPRVGSLVGDRYRLVAPLGKGAMGVVYVAIDERVWKRAAVKVLFQDFAIEAELAGARIEHPHVASVLDVGRLPPSPYAPESWFLAMELLQGHDLEHEIAGYAPLPPRRAVAITLQVARGLGAVHQQGLVHRDVKPANVFLHQPRGQSEVVKILDFGIAQRIHPSQPARPAGSIDYMAPEQLVPLVGELIRRGAGTQPIQNLAPVDARADVFALGATLFQMLTGKRPFTLFARGADLPTVLCQHLWARLTQRPEDLTKGTVPSGVSEALTGVLARALAARPSDRFETIFEMERALVATPEHAGRGAAPAPIRSDSLDNAAVEEEITREIVAPDAVAFDRSASAVGPGVQLWHLNEGDRRVFRPFGDVGPAIEIGRRRVFSLGDGQFVDQGTRKPDVAIPPGARRRVKLRTERRDYDLLLDGGDVRDAYVAFDLGPCGAYREAREGAEELFAVAAPDANQAVIVCLIKP